MSSITTARTDPWRCAACGSAYDLAPLAAEVGLVRLAVKGTQGFALGSTGIESDVSPLLAPCACGGRLEPGAGEGEPAGRAGFDAGALRPLAERGWALLQDTHDPRLAELALVWRPRALRVLGREAELTPLEVQELKLEGRLQDLMDELRRAQAAGDQDAAEAAHARYVELGTAYVHRFVRGQRAG
ncbi:MAG: hypothetical protein ACTHNU_03435 [Gaiellales bacterium]